MSIKELSLGYRAIRPDGSGSPLFDSAHQAEQWALAQTPLPEGQRWTIHGQSVSVEPSGVVRRP